MVLELPRLPCPSPADRPALAGGWAVVLGLAALLFTGCQAPPLEGGRYACVIDGGEDQCPEQWRCGFEGYCHEVGNTEVSWRCVDDSHCEGGWKCGLDQTRDGGECHDPAGLIAHACFEDTHCTAQWHCGPAGRCYDRTVKADHVCRFDAGDCADHWRCGLNGRCQDQDAGAPYPCRGDAGLEDSWCELGWRCAPEGQCIDPASDALVGRTLPSDSGAIIHPLAPGLLERFAVSQQFESGSVAGEQTVAFVQDGQLRARFMAADASYTRYALGEWDGGVALAALGSRGELEAGGTIFFDDQPRLFVARADGGIEVTTLKPDAGFLREKVNTDYPFSRLSLGSAHGALSPRVVAFNPVPDYYFRLLGGPDESALGGELQEYGRTVRFDQEVANNRTVEVVSVRPSQLVECIFAVDQRGLWAAQRSFDPAYNYPFEVIELPHLTNDRCRPPAASTHRITGLAPYGRDWLAASSRATDGGAHVTLLDLRPLWSRPDPELTCTSELGEACTPGDRIPVETRMGPCPVCLGQQLLDFAVTIDPNGEPNVEVRCGASDGGLSGFFVLEPQPSGTQCSRRIAEGESGVFSRTALLAPEHQAPGQVAWASTDGFIWRGSSSTRVTSELFDRAPSAVARRGPLLSDLVVFAGEVTASFAPGVGLVATSQTRAVSAVAGAPEWVITNQRLVLDLAGTTAENTQLGVVGNPLSSFAPPHLAALTRSATGRVLVVSSGSALFSAEMEATLSGQQGYAALGLRAVGPSQLDSLAFPEQPTAGVYLRGYAVTPNGVLRLTAQTPTRWSFEEVALPTQLIPQEVWFEQERGRVGFADGTVYSLPSRVPIAAPLDDGVVDYAQACGQQLALGVAGLFRLELEPGRTIGSWKPLPLPPGFAGNGFARGRVHGVGSAVYVFKPTGEAARLSFEGCPSP